MSSAISVQDYETLKRRVDELKAKKERAKGALEQTMKTIQEEFGCKTLEEVQDTQKKLDAEEKKALDEYLKLVEEFKETWGDLLGV